MASGIYLIISFTLVLSSKQFLPVDIKTINGMQSDLPLPGIGYSSDKGYLAPTICFTPVTINTSGQQAILKFDQGMKVSQIYEDFNVAATINGGYGKFSSNALFNYLKSIEENKFSISISYYLKVSSSRVMTFSYNPKTILNEVGQSIYKENYDMFRIFCGDTLIKSYDEGAALVYNLNINLRDSNMKETILAELGFGIGSLFQASGKLQSISQKYNFEGSISVSAYQMGGSPEELGAVLDPSIAQCDIKHTDKCQNVINALIQYQQTKFPQQFKKEGSIWTSPIVFLGGYATDFKLTDFGLKIAPSFVTNEVEIERKKLLLEQKKNEYYQRNFEILLKSYPIPLDAAVINQSTNALNIIQNNLQILKVGVNQKSPLDCWDYPFRCTESSKEILSQILDIDYIPFQECNSKYQYYLVAWGPKRGLFWPTGSSCSYQPYTYEMNKNEHNWYIINGIVSIRPDLIILNNGWYHDGGDCPQDEAFYIQQQDPSKGCVTINLKLHSSGPCHQGDQWHQSQSEIQSILNPYYFDYFEPQYEISICDYSTILVDQNDKQISISCKEQANLINIGQSYCAILLKKENVYTIQNLQWSEAFRKCLKQTIAEQLLQICLASEQFYLNSLVNCFVEPVQGNQDISFCFINEDYYEILKEIYFSITAQSIINIGRECSKKYALDVNSHLQNAINKIIGVQS